MVGGEPPVQLARIRQALERAVVLGLDAPDRPLKFGLQPVLEVNLTFVDDANIRELNRHYRGMDAATDVLSFSQIEGDGSFVTAPTGALALGDVVISSETARRQADDLGHDLDYELCLLAAHGALHLLGYDHASDADATRMNGLTREALSGLGFGGVLDQRVLG